MAHFSRPTIDKVDKQEAGPRPSLLTRGVLRPLQSFGEAQFRWYWVSMIAQFSAFQMQLIAKSWFVYDLTNSAILVGVVGAAQGTPILLLSPFGGVLADRLNKRNIIILGQTLAATGSLIIALILTLGTIQVWHIVVTSLLQGTGMAFMQPSRQALVAELVNRNKLLNAVSLASAGTNLARIFAPAIGGYLVEFIGISGVFYIVTALYIASIVLIIPVSVTKKQSTNSKAPKSIVQETLEGWRYIRSNEVLLLLLTVGLVTVLFGMPYNQLLPVYTTNVLHVGPGSLGTLMSVTGIGALIASLGVASLGDYKYKGILLIAFTVLFGLALASLGATSGYWLAIIIMLPIGVGQTSRMNLNNTLIMMHTADHVRGRVMSVMMMEFGLMPLGSIPLAIIADFAGVDTALMTMGAVVVVLGLFLGMRPAIRKL